MAFPWNILFNLATSVGPGLVDTYLKNKKPKAEPEKEKTADPTIDELLKVTTLHQASITELKDDISLLKNQVHQLITLVQWLLLAVVLMILTGVLWLFLR